MKKKFILAIFGISLLFMACQEDSYYNDYDMGGKNLSILTEAMKLIEDNHNFVSLPDLDKTLKGGSVTRSSGSNHSLRYKEEDFIFDWGEADVMKSKLAEVVIAPVRYNKEVALRTFTLEGNSRKRETTPLYSMLYMRKMLETGQTHAYILSFAPDRDYINACEENGEELQLYPNPQGSDFCGIQFFSTIYGEITHGVRYENGRKCYYILPRSERNRDFIERHHREYCSSQECDSEHSNVKMSLEFVTFMSATRSTYSNNSEDYNNLTCSFCGKNVNDCTCLEIVGCRVCRKRPCECGDIPEEEEEDRCNDCCLPVQWCGCGSSWNDSGSTSGPNPGGYQPNYPPSNPPGGNSGGSSGNGGDVIVTPNSLLKSIGIIKSTISGSDLATLNKCMLAFNNIKYYEELYKLLSAKNPNISFTIEKKFVNGIAIEAGFIRADNTIYFFSSDKIQEAYLTEELLHAIQFHSFYGDTMGDYAMGNIELEVRMIKDIIDKLTGGLFCYTCGFITDDQLSADYDLWLTEMDFSRYSEWYDSLLPHFKYGEAKIDTSKVAHPMLDWLYNYIINTPQK